MIKVTRSTFDILGIYALREHFLYRIFLINNADSLYMILRFLYYFAFPGIRPLLFGRPYNLCVIYLTFLYIFCQSCCLYRSNYMYTVSCGKYSLLVYYIIPLCYIYRNFRLAFKNEIIRYVAKSFCSTIVTFIYG